MHHHLQAGGYFLRSVRVSNEYGPLNWKCKYLRQVLLVPLEGKLCAQRIALEDVLVPTLVLGYATPSAAAAGTQLW